MDVAREADNDSHHFVGTLHVLMALESLRRKSAAFDPRFGTEFDLQALRGPLVAAMGFEMQSPKASGHSPALTGNKKKRRRSRASEVKAIKKIVDRYRFTVQR